MKMWEFALAIAMITVPMLCHPDTISGSQPWKQEQFFITLWSVPPGTDDILSRVEAENFNLTWAKPEELYAVARHRLRALVTDPLIRIDSFRDLAKRDQLIALVDRTKNHPALEGYILADEPGDGSFADLARLVQFLRERDPAHFAYINLFPVYATAEQLGVQADTTPHRYEDKIPGIRSDDKYVLNYRAYLDAFTSTVKPAFLSYYHYHFLKADGNGKPVDGAQYFLNLALIRESAQCAGISFLSVIQANTIMGGWRLPNANELRLLVFSTLAYGGRGISYFTYWGPKSYNGIYEDGKPSPLLTPHCVPK